MSKEKVKLLVLESDRDRIDAILKHFGDQLYSIESALNWKDGLEMILNRKYDVIILSVRMSKSKEDASNFLMDLEKKYWDRNIPFIVSVSGKDDIEAIKRFSKLKIKFVNKNIKDFLVELEWAVVNLVPRAFYNYREILIKIERDYQAIEKNSSSILKINKKLKEMNKKFINKESIIETLGVFLAAFSLSIGVIVSFILLFFQQEIKNSHKVVYVWHIFIALVILISVCGLIIYFRLRKKVKQMVKDELANL